MNLSVIRTYRTQIEEALRLELAELQRSLHVEQQIQQVLLTEVEAGTAEFLKMAHAGMTVDEARAQQGKLDGLAQAIRKARETIAMAQRRYEQKLTEVVEASRERKKLEILEERDAVRKTKLEQRREQSALDQAASARFRTREAGNEA